MILEVILLLLILTFFLITLLNVLFWPRIRRTTSNGHDFTNSLSVLIPARNEAHTITECVRSVLQQGTVVREVIVYDDGSNDGTGDIVQGLAELDRRVRLISGSPLPDGWCGKPHACMRLSEKAEGSWMLFLDADARLKPNGALALLETARKRKVTFLSAWPEFELRNFSERLLMPMLNFFVFTVFPSLGSLISNNPRFGLAHGACILVERSTYQRIGGHSLVRQELFEDTILARRWRELGERGLGLDGSETVRVRMYEGFGAIWLGFQKNFYPGFRSKIVFWVFLLFHVALYLLPFLALPFAAQGPDAEVVFGAVLLVLGMRLMLAVRFRDPFWSFLLHPVAELFLIAVGIRSWWRWSHGGVDWKGRTYSSHVGRGIVAEGMVRQ
jgi:glycosyltransferase involved in cell wall biosynthesis